MLTNHSGLASKVAVRVQRGGCAGEVQVIWWNCQQAVHLNPLPETLECLVSALNEFEFGDQIIG